MDFKTLRDCQPASLDAVIDKWSKICDKFTTAKQTATGSVGTQMRSGSWEGESATSAQSRLSQYEGQLSAGHTEANAMKQILGQAKSLFGDAKARLDKAIAEAEKNELLSLTDKGEVKLDSKGLHARAGDSPIAVVMVDAMNTQKRLQIEITKAVAVAAYTDAQVAKALREAAKGDPYFNAGAKLPAAFGSTIPQLIDDMYKSVKLDKNTIFEALFGLKKQGMTEKERQMLEKLSPTELLALDQTRKLAEKAAIERYGAGTQFDGTADAFRHAYWNALMAERFGQKWADDFATAHEGAPKSLPQASAMDLHNNEIGRQVARDNPGVHPLALQRLIDEKLRDGSLMVYDKNGNLVPSNQVPLPKSNS